MPYSQHRPVFSIVLFLLPEWEKAQLKIPISSIPINSIGFNCKKKIMGGNPIIEEMGNKTLSKTCHRNKRLHIKVCCAIYCLKGYLPPKCSQGFSEVTFEFIFVHTKIIHDIIIKISHEIVRA